MKPSIDSIEAFDASELPPLPEPLPATVVDSHTHLDSTREYSGLSVALNLELAGRVGVTRAVEIGCDVPSSEFAVDLAGRDERVVAAVAIHPNDAARASDDDVDAAITRIDELAARGRHVRAVGETGLDFFRTKEASGIARQRRSFAAHIEIAKRHGLTLAIHDRDAHAEVLEVLDEVGAPERVIMHCFSGDAVFAAECARRGYWMSFPGVVTFGTADPLREALAVVPEHLLLVETDAPYLTPKPQRGRPNAPYLLPHTVRFVAEQRGVDAAELCGLLTANTDAAYGGTWGAA